MLSKHETGGCEFHFRPSRIRRQMKKNHLFMAIVAMGLAVMPTIAGAQSIWGTWSPAQPGSFWGSVLSFFGIA